MLKRIIILIFFYLLHSLTYAQGISNQWVLGYQGGGGNIFLSFDSSSVQVDTMRGKMNFEETNTSICDKNGNLLFYTNGIWIANNMHDTMTNGSGLSPSNFTTYWNADGLRIEQGSLIIPFPDDSSRYYLFHETAYFDSQLNLYPPHLLYKSIIDMKLDSSRGAVVLKNDTLLQDTLLYGNLTACKHANGRDWWVICHRTRSNLFYKLLITPAGILGPFIQNIGNILYEGNIGQSVFSPDGNHLAYYTMHDGINIFDFDRCSGNFYNSTHISTQDSTGFACGVAFSSNSIYLYVSSFLRVYQFDIEASNIAASIDTVAVFDGYASPNPPFYTQFYLAQLALDGKIYISAPNSVQHLHVINFPDSVNSSCGFAQHSLFLKAYNGFSIPNHPNYFLGVDSGSICDTLHVGIKNKSKEMQHLRLSVFPNPSKNNLQISYLSNDKVGTFEVFDVNGASVLNIRIPQWTQMQQINVSRLPNGIYLGKLTYKSNSVNCRFIVAH